MIRHLTVEQATELTRRLDDHVWTWTMSEIQPILQAAQLTPLETLTGASIAISHPDLPDVQGFVVNLQQHSMVLELNITLTELVQRDDDLAQQQLSAVFSNYMEGIISIFGDPDDYPKETVVVWDRGEELVKLRRLGIAVDLSLQSKESRRLYEEG